MMNNTRMRGAATSERQLFGFPFVWHVLVITILLAFADKATAAREFGSGSDRFAGVALFVRTVVEAGGEELVSATSEDEKVTSLNAGDGTVWEGGIRLDWRLLDRLAWETELAIGAKSTQRTTGDGSLSFQRIVLSGVQFYRFKSGIRVGAGFAAHLRPIVDVSAAGFQTEAQTLDTAFGLSLMLDYGVFRWMSLGLRATSLTYEYESGSIDASSIGAYVTFRHR